MKGRPVTGEELWKLLKATRKVVGAKVAKHWRRLIIGLWWGGLRIGEAVRLRWAGDDMAEGLVIDMSGKRPMLRIDAAHEKGNRNRLLPLVARVLPVACPCSERQAAVGFLPPPPENRTADVVGALTFPRSSAISASGQGSRCEPRPRASLIRRPGNGSPLKWSSLLLPMTCGGRSVNDGQSGCCRKSSWN